MIRDITPEDKEEVLRLARMFFKERLERCGSYFSPGHASTHFDLFIKTPGLLALCAEKNGKLVGMIAGVASTILFAKELAMQEMVWYVEPGHRSCGLKLLRSFEDQARARGVEQLMMVGMAGDPVLEFYKRVGFIETQRTFMKWLR